jgi:glycosyltransferase involved in cell wall biosynthesis
MNTSKQMKILCVIDHFGSGGAQRQLVTLAIQLASLGHEVHFFIYYPGYDFFRDEVQQAGIRVYECPKRRKGFSLAVLKDLRNLIIDNKYDIALAFLDTPSIYLLLAGIATKTKLIVSDRSSYIKNNSIGLKFKRQLYRLADNIVANSFTQHNWLVNCAYMLSNKVITIYNGYDTKIFFYAPLVPDTKKSLSWVCVGRISPVKNLVALIEGLDIFYRRNNWCPRITWVGITDNSEYQHTILELLESRPEVKKYGHGQDREMTFRSC